MPLSGIVARVMWHYYPAAAVNNYIIARDPQHGGLTVSGTVVLQDAYKLAQRPLVFEAPWRVKATDTHPEQQGVWRWPIEAFTISEAGHLTARLGPEETPAYGALSQA
jgi:hypothetical protein